jgi:hypothetical protein
MLRLERPRLLTTARFYDGLYSPLAPRPSPLAPRPSPLAPRPSPLAPRPLGCARRPRLA